MKETQIFKRKGRAGPGFELPVVFYSSKVVSFGLLKLRLSPYDIIVAY